MKRRSTLPALMLLVAACQRGAEPRPAETAARETAPTPTTAAPLDGRTPVPLTAMMATHQKEQMRDHLRVVGEITAALGKDDFDAVVAAAARIAWSEQQAVMCQHMGADTPGFAARGEHFHKTADGIVAAARQRDRAQVMSALGATLDTCVGCHETYRQEIVADARSGEAP